MDKRLKHINALRCFESAARYQSYSKAADELFVSQAAVSQQMRQLENALDIKLFFRNGRNMQLTQSGEKLYQSIHQALGIIVKGLNSIQCEGLAGDLTITSTHAFCALWIMPRLYRFNQLHPDINIKIMGSNQIENLETQQIDLAIRFSTKPFDDTNSNLIYEYLGEDFVYPVCSPELKNHVKLNSPQDLMNCSLVCYANEKVVTWQEWFEHVAVQGYELHNQKTEVTSSDMALGAVLSGHGVALVSTALFSQYIQTQQLIVPFKIKHPVHWKKYIAFNKNSTKIKRIRVFADWIQAEMKNSPKLFVIE
ncbi:LysR substrate-binding domain-containing protein [Pseudoalteromonas denitrificans]|uniref:LysR family transcriptional regulator, glycine cleavage system transcriptional activator n=1 Tax=Pseudoalteromonas denitrificans DSM 6059 TaxID=1123010 RepID=A0A1I1KDK6_9GAMM|nr:LysR substrate-binding domain-containing protein [Pseudoalteromonas denitrificans]SFC58372.1 LysR family transcriptional regulator, glycine cleavage system transcriptional activator [Pseudoalteromonas denitrificans DSM 6059]